MVYSDPSLNYSKPQWLVQTLADLERHEGFRQFAYPDPRSLLARKYKERKWSWGFERGDVLLARYGESERDGRPWTYGHGFTHGVTPASSISLSQSRRKLEPEVIDHVKGLDVLIPSWRTMPVFAQTVLANMIFNLGYVKMKAFAPTLHQFALGNYSTAADRLTRTAWYKQVGSRSKELVTRLYTRSIDPKHKVI